MFRELIDNQVEINGVVQASFDTKTSLIGIVLACLRWPM